MSFNEETPLEDVLKYIKQATTTKTYAGIPIYVDPGGLEEVDQTMTSTVTQLDLEGDPAQDDASALAQAVGAGLLRARRRTHHQLATGHLRRAQGGPTRTGHDEGNEGFGGGRRREGKAAQPEAVEP